MTLRVADLMIAKFHTTGNIAETFWKTSTDNVQRKYDYKYDDLNRLLQADYSKYI